MNKQEFTEAIANGTGFGLWTNAAQEAIKKEQYDLFVDHWKEQYEDPGSRPNVEKTLGRVLLNILIDLITYTYEDLENDLKKMNPIEKKRPVTVWREEEAYPIGGLTNDRQPYYKDEEGLHLPKDQYDALSREEREEWELSKPDGITVLCEDF